MNKKTKVEETLSELFVPTSIMVYIKQFIKIKLD